MLYFSLALTFFFLAAATYAMGLTIVISVGCLLLALYFLEIGSK